MLYHATASNHPLMFTAKENLRQAIVVLPAAKSGRISDSTQRRWLSRAALSDCASPVDIIARVLSAAGLPPLEDGLAALRLWGQTGDRPTVWIAAADPVHLEARLNHVLLRTLGAAQAQKSEIRALIDFLQKSLGEGSGFAFALVGKLAYLRGDEAIATAPLSAAAIDGLEPAAFMPAGAAASGYLRLLSEAQMCLHDHEINQRREAAGLMPINSVWIWGGGRAPQKTVRVLPPMFGDDPLLKGYWESCTGVVAPWPGNFKECLEFALKDFVVITPQTGGAGDALGMYLAELQAMLNSGRLDRLQLLFRDGLTARFGPFDRFRFWRRSSALL